MSNLRIRLKLNEGGEGVPLYQLYEVAEEAEKFFRYLAEDVGIRVPRQLWLARAFDDSHSLAFDTVAGVPISVTEVKGFNIAFQHVADLDPQQPKLNGFVRLQTVAQYVRIAERVLPHEKVEFGLYRPTDAQPFKWNSLSHATALALKERIEEQVSYTGTLQGKVHAITIETPMWFHMRPSGGGNLIRCDMNPAVYAELVKIIERPEALIYAHGEIRARRIDQQILDIKVKAVKGAPLLTRERYEAYFGADPSYTGDRSTEDAIEDFRDYDA